jgi:hypothetical protein
MNKETLRAKIDEFLDTLDNDSREEWWVTDRVGHEVGLEAFYNWLYADDIAKEARRQEYLKLKAEFEPTPN